MRNKTAGANETKMICKNIISAGCLTIILLADCQNKKESIDTFQPQLVGIWTDSLEHTINWYVENLGFGIEKEIKAYPDYNLRVAFIKKGDFHLELLERKPSYPFSDINEHNDHYLGGVFKLGFIVENIQETYDELKAKKNVEFVTEIDNLPVNNIGLKWPGIYFLIKDIDGNFIQFFSHEDGTPSNPNPWLVMLVVRNMGKSISWYTNNLNFTHHVTIGDPGNKRAILSRNGYVLELFEPSSVTHRKTISMDSTMLGFNKLAFGIQHFDSLTEDLKSKNIEFAVEPDSSVFGWASRAMIVKDEELNWIQFFELTR